MKYLRILFLSCIVLVCGCKKDEISEPLPPTFLYEGLCTIAEVYWMTDNTHIIMNDFCGGTIPYLNVIEGTVKELSILPGYVIQRIFVSPEIQGYFYCLALQPGSTVFELFSYKVSTGATLLIKDGIEANPISSRYLVGGHRLAIPGDPIQIINLETGNSSTLPKDGIVKAFSPDGSQLIYYSLAGGQAQFTGAWIYDFTCECETPITINAYALGVIWNTVGQYGSEAVAANGSIFSPYNLVVTDLQGGIELALFMNYLGGPWYNAWDTTGYYFTEDLDASDEEGLVLNKYDFSTATSSNIFKARISTGTSSPFIGQNQLAISPDGKKVVFVERGSALRGVW